MPFKNTFWHFKWHIKRQDTHAPCPHFCIFYFRQLQSKALHPGRHIFFAHTGPEPLSFQPIPGSCHLRQKLPALADAGRSGSAEGDHCLACKVIVLHKGIYRPCGDSPPDGILNRRSSSLDFENIGFNALHKCILCSRFTEDSSYLKVLPFVLHCSSSVNFSTNAYTLL